MLTSNNRIVRLQKWKYKRNGSDAGKFPLLSGRLVLSSSAILDSGFTSEIYPNSELLWPDSAISWPADQLKY
jgi:hypothetical protein